MKERRRNSLSRTAGTNQQMAYRIDLPAPQLQAGHPSKKAVVATTLTNTANNSVAKVTAKAVVSSETALRAGVQKAWVAYKTTEKYGIELGKALFDYRGGHKSKGGFGSEGRGLVQLLDELRIPHSTGYWWINRYEVSVGLKEAKPTQVVSAPLPPSSEPEPEPEGEYEPPNLGKMRRKGRCASPVADDSEIESLALKILNAGYKALLANGGDGEYSAKLRRAHKVAEETIRMEFEARKAMANQRIQDKKAFEADPSKCWQRRVRESYAQLEGKPQLLSLKGARVKPISSIQASPLIEQYEWKGRMAAATAASYGLFLNDELLGVACFASGTGSPESLRITKCASKPIIFARGACVPSAPKDAASCLIRHACRLAHKEHGWDVFIGYADEQAGEIGTVYQAVGWHFIGKAPQGNKSFFTSHDGKLTISSYDFSKRREGKFRDLGWNGTDGKYDFLRRLGYIEHPEAIKRRYIWFEGDRKRKAELAKSCRFKPQPYPKRLPAPEREVGFSSSFPAVKKPVQSVKFYERGGQEHRTKIARQGRMILRAALVQ